MPDGIMSLFEGTENLSDGFKEQVKTIFEAALSDRVSAIRVELESENESKLQEQAEAAIADMEQKVDQFLSYVAEEWMEKNQVAVDKGIALEISESFLSGLKDLFTEHYVEVPEEKVDVVAEMANTIEELEDEKNEAVNENVTLKQQVAKYRKKEIIDEMTVGLADSEKDKLHSLVEEITFTDDESFKTKLGTIAENFLGKTLNESEDEEDDEPDDDADDKKVKKDGKDKKPFKEGKEPASETNLNEGVDSHVQYYADAMTKKGIY